MRATESTARTIPFPVGATRPQPASATRPRADDSTRPPGLGRSAALLVAVTRPRILLLVAATALPVVAAGLPAARVPVVLAAFVSLLLAGASCSALNAWLERDIDAAMERTRGRPLPAGLLAPRTVVAFGLATGALAIALPLALGAWLASALVAATIVHYVAVYTAWLKRRTPQNIVIGGVAGATAPLIVSAAATGAISPLAWVVFLIVVAWTPPHFWSIACYRRDEYAAAGVPMLPVVVGRAASRRQGLLWALTLPPLGAATALLGAVPAWAGLAAAGLGLWYLCALVDAIRRRDDAADRAAFLASVRYLAALVFVLAVGAALA